MTYKERKEKEKHLLYLIERGWLSSLEKVATDFDCSVRTIERILKDLKEEGHDICYCRVQNIYVIKK